MIIDKVVVAVIKALAKQFKLDKLEQVYKYVFDRNDLDKANVGIFKSIKEFQDKIKQMPLLDQKERLRAELAHKVTNPTHPFFQLE